MYELNLESSFISYFFKRIGFIVQIFQRRRENLPSYIFLLFNSNSCWIWTICHIYQAKMPFLCPTENILQVLSGNTPICEGSARVEQSFYREKLNKFWTNEHETGKTGTDFMNLSQFDIVNILSKVQLSSSYRLGQTMS